MNTGDLEEKEEAVKEQIINEILGQMDDELFNSRVFTHEQVQDHLEDEEEKEEQEMAEYVAKKSTITESMAGVQPVPKLFNDSSNHPDVYKRLRHFLVRYLFDNLPQDEDDEEMKPMPNEMKRLPQMKIGEALTQDNIIQIVKLLMMWMREVKELTGEEKKRLIIEVLQDFVRKHDAGHLDVLDPIIIHIIPIVIDEFVQLNKTGQLVFTMEKSKVRFSKLKQGIKSISCCKKTPAQEPKNEIVPNPEPANAEPSNPENKV
jgi:hypothetical protein